MDRTVVALFDDVSTAQRALEELLTKGFDRSAISVVRTNEGAEHTSGTTTTESTDASGAATGAGIGAVLGGIAGLVIGLGVLAIPGIGPVVAAGPLAATLAGAGIGAATGGIIGALTDVGIPEEEAGYYAEGIRRGGTLLTVRATENQVSVATQILNRFSPINVTERAGEWRSSGWSGYDPNASNEERGTMGTTGSMGSTGMGGTGSMGTTGMTGTGSTGMSGTGSMGTTGMTGTGSMGSTGMGGTGSMGLTGTGGTFASRFEDFDTDFRSDWQKRSQTSGFGYERYQPAYRYGFESRGRHQGRNWNDVEGDLRSDWQRNHPSDKWEDFKDSIRTGWERFKGGVSDTAHDAGRAVDNMKDDMRQGSREFGRTAENNTRDAAGDVRDATQGYGQEVGRMYDRTTGDMSRSFDRYDTDFRSNFDQSYRSRGFGYERYQPAYQYGYTLATEKRYRGRDWNAIESDARRDWETGHPGDSWDDFKDAVRHAWQRVKADVRDAID